MKIKGFKISLYHTLKNYDFFLFFFVLFEEDGLGLMASAFMSVLSSAVMPIIRYAKTDVFHYSNIESI